MEARGWVWTGPGVGLVRLRWCRKLPGRRGLGDYVEEDSPSIRAITCPIPTTTSPSRAQMA